MKKIVVLFIVCLLSFASYGQKITQVVLADAATLTDNDTTVWIPMKDMRGRHIEIFWSDLSAATDSLDIGMSNNDTTYFSVGDIFSVPFPLEMVKTADYKTVSEGATKYGVAVDADQWNAKYAVFKYVKVGSTTGQLILQY